MERDIKDFNTFIYDHSLYRERKHFCRYCLNAFITEEILKNRIKCCFKVRGKQRIVMPKKAQYVKLKNYDRKINSSFVPYADFGSILVPENNGKQNPEESYTNKYQKHIVCSHGYKLVSKLVCKYKLVNQPLKTYLSENDVYSFVNNMIEESKCCSDLVKKHFKKEL